MDTQIRYHNGAIIHVRLGTMLEIIQYLKDPKVMKVSFTLLDARLILYPDGTYLLNEGSTIFPPLSY